MNQKWYLQTWFICLMFALWFFIIPGIIGIVLLVMQLLDNQKTEKEFSNLTINLEISDNARKNLLSQVSSLENKLTELGAKDILEAKKKLEILEENIATLETAFNNDSQANNKIISKLRDEISALEDKREKLIKQALTSEKKLQRLKELYQSVSYAIDNFINAPLDYNNCKLSTIDFEEYELVAPSITLKLHCMDVKDLRKAYREVEKQINTVLEHYSARYTTKANKSIYQLMVIALRAELQNILYELKYEKLDAAIEKVKTMTAKYLKIAGEGNQSIAGTLTKFIGEIEYLFIDAVKIEYNYYVKKEQAKQEQLAIREQMRQEAEERRILEQERKKVEQEENKYSTEISKLQNQLSSASDEEIQKLNERILQLQAQLSDVIVKKDEIVNLQNGKAGNVYIISNLGSFGENMFKVGMTRRLNPQERIDELGSASVPFKFDVHSFIFSEDAVGLENKLHSILNEKRVNKVNLRKEFFYSSVDELESIVLDIDPTAEFNKTMLAEDFRQSQSSDKLYTTEYESDEFNEDE